MKARSVISGILALGIFAAIVCALARPASAVQMRLRIGYNVGFGIYQTENADGEATGVHIELMDALARHQLLSLEYVPYERTTDCYAALESGEIDAILGAPADDSALQGYDFFQSNPLSTYTLCLVADNSIAAEIDETGTLTGYLGAIEVGHNQKSMAYFQVRDKTVFSRNTFILSQSQKEMLDWLEQDRVDFLVCEKENALRHLKEINATNQYTVALNYLLEIDSVILLRASDFSLQREINAGLAALRSSGDYDTIMKKWFENDGIALSRRTLQTILITAGILVIFVGVYIISSLRVRSVLRREVERRTRELKEANDILHKNVELLQKESELRTNIIETSSSAMVLYDSRRRVLFLNQEAAKISGAHVRQSIERPVDSLPLFGELLRLGEWAEEPKIFQLSWKGKSRMFRCGRFTVPSPNDEENVLLSVEDVTREEQEKQAFFEVEKNRALNTLVAGIAHEIKNPLTAIQNYSALIPEQKSNEEFLTSFSKFVPKETQRINGLIESLLNYARPAKGDVSVIDLEDLLTSCTGLLFSVAKQSGIKIQTRFEKDIKVRGHRDHIQQALINYLTNAIDAVKQRSELEHGEPGLISVILIDWEGAARIEIYDQGIGMDEETARQCMEPFYTTKDKGTGLGMATALQRIRENRGDVWVESVKGEFTRITIEFERVVL